MKKHFTLVLILLLTAVGNLLFAQNIWQPTKGPNGLSIADFAITTDHVLVLSAINSGIYFSTDNGASWERRNIGLYSPNSYATSIETGPDGIVYALIDSELYRMEKGSTEWDKTIYKFEYGTLAANQNGSLFVISDFIDLAILISKDKGNTFKTILNNSDFRVNSFSMNGNNNNYLLGYESGGDDAVYRLTDDGKEFKKIYTLNFGFADMYWHPSGHLFVSDVFEGLIRMDSLGNNVRIIKSNASSANTMAIKANGNLMSYTYDGDYESSDLGNNWTIKNSEIYKKADRGSRVFIDGADHYVLGFGCVEPLSKTSDEGISWTDFDSKFTNPEVEELFIDKAGRMFANICYAGSYAYSDDKGEHWYQLNLPNDDEGFTDLTSSITGNLFIRSYDKLYKSSDAGLNWIETSILNETMFDVLTGDHDKIIFASAFGRSFISTDGGNTFKEIPNLQIPFSEVVVHPDGTIFGIVNDFFSAVYYSTDQGMTWTESDLQFESLYAFHITKTGIIYFSGYSHVTNDNGTFVSNDKLATWQNVSSETYRTIVSDNDGTIYANEIFGLCRRSTDGGKTWRPYVSGLPAEGYSIGLAIDKEQYLYISLEYDVVHRTIKPVTTTIATGNDQSAYTLQITPNPAKDEIFISISGNHLYSDQWALTDITGQTVLADKIKGSEFKITVDNLPNGIYFFKVPESRLPVQKIVVQR